MSHRTRFSVLVIPVSAKASALAAMGRGARLPAVPRTRRETPKKEMRRRHGKHPLATLRAVMEA